MKKHKIIYGLVAVLCLNIILPMAVLANVTDVPADHWAYHAVNAAVTRGYLTVFEDGTFQGTRAVDRYALANVINRLLEDIEVSRVRGTSGDLVEVSELRLRFEEDLATWYADQQTLRDDVKRVTDNAVISEERVSRVVSAQVDLEDRLSALQNELVMLQNSVTEVQAGVVGVQLAMDEQSMDGSERELRLNELVGAVIQLEKEQMLQAEAINSLENWAGEKGAVLATLQAADSSLTDELNALRLSNQQLEKDIQNLAVMLQRETQNRSTLANDLEQVKSDIITLRQDTSGLESVKNELATDVNAQINAALIREQRLERQIKTLEEDFEAYKVNAEKDLKSAKTFATIGIALGAIGAIIGAIGMMGN